MKKFFSLILVLVLLGSFNATSFAEDVIYVTVDGIYVEFDVVPQTINGRTMVPIRAIFEKMGAVVEWDNDTNSAICTKASTVVKMTVDDMNMYINNQEFKMDVAPVVIDGRTLAPARYVAEAFGADVEWDEETNTVVISTQPQNMVTLYALDGRTIDVPVAEVPAYLNVGWYNTLEETQQTLYAMDGRTITVFKDEVPAYLNVGWYSTLDETQQVMYAPDGREIIVYKSEVDAYKNVGWYETQYQAQSVNKGTSSYNPNADGYCYRTPKGKKYHLDPNCGGKNSYRTNNISGLSPCSKCAM